MAPEVSSVKIHPNKYFSFPSGFIILLNFCYALRNYLSLAAVLLLIMASAVSSLDKTRADVEKKMWDLHMTLGGPRTGTAHLELHLSLGVAATGNSESGPNQGGAADENKEVGPNQGGVATEKEEFVTASGIATLLVGLRKIVKRRGKIGITAILHEKPIIISGRIVWTGFNGSVSCPFDFVI